jgi:hypothetical protein
MMKKERKSSKQTAAPAHPKGADLVAGETSQQLAPEVPVTAPAQSSQAAAAEPRAEARETVELRSIVQYKDNGETWKETAVVHSASRAGAGLNVSRPCAVGRLVTLVLPLATSLRAYDFHERLYPVMGVVQYCHEITLDGQISYNIGVAFIGKNIPKSYSADSSQNYRLSGMDANGLWKIAEVEKDFNVRRHSRFWVEVEVSLTILQKDRKAVCKDVTATQDISAGGAALRSAVVANIGDKVKFTCKKYNFFSMAIVRGRSVDGGDQPTIHLEFLDAQFPIHLLPKPEDMPKEEQSDHKHIPPAPAPGFAVERF